MKEKRVKKKNFRYVKIIITAITGIISLLIGTALINVSNSGLNIRIDGDGNSIDFSPDTWSLLGYAVVSVPDRSSNVNVIGDKNIINSSDISIDNGDKNYIWRDFDFEEKTEEELLRMAKSACLNEDYSYAYEIYTSSKISSEKEALINRGYLLSAEKIQEEDNFQKAIDCYMAIKDKDVNVYRNLLASIMKNKTGTVISDYEMEKFILEQLLYVYDDDVTWDYISLCLYDVPFDEYCETYDVSKEEMAVDISELYRYKYNGDVYLTYSPIDTVFEKYVWIDSSNWINDYQSGTVHRYEKWVPSYYINIEKIEKLYFQ